MFPPSGCSVWLHRWARDSFLIRREGQASGTAEPGDHDPSAFRRQTGQCTDIQIQARQILRIKDRLNHILAENTGKPVETIAEDCERDNFMTAEEAQAYGLVDKVIYKR